MPRRLDLDHLGLAVRDLNAAARIYTALGFDLAPKSFHTVGGTGGDLKPAGTANQCAMLRQGYVELITVVDTSAESYNRRQIGGFIEAFEGIHIMALATGDAAGTRDALLAAGFATADVRELRRRIDGPGGRGEAWFRLVMPALLERPDSVTFFIEHKTRDLVWSSGPNEHRNGAVALDEVAIVVDDPQARPLYESLLGVKSEADAGTVRFALDNSRLVLLDRDTAAARYGQPVPDYPAPFAVGYTVTVRALSASRAVLRQAGVKFADAGARLTVAPRDACGAFLQFAEVRR